MELFSEAWHYWVLGLFILSIMAVNIYCAKSENELWGDDLQRVRTKKDNKVHY